MFWRSMKHLVSYLPPSKKKERKSLREFHIASPVCSVSIIFFFLPERSLIDFLWSLPRSLRSDGGTDTEPFQLAHAAVTQCVHILCLLSLEARGEGWEEFYSEKEAHVSNTGTHYMLSSLCHVFRSLLHCLAWFSSFWSLYLTSCVASGKLFLGSTPKFLGVRGSKNQTSHRWKHELRWELYRNITL